MATRSTIAKLNDDGTLTSIYCHWDGYPEGVGSMLKKHYTDPHKINQLLTLGDISSLHEDIGEQHDFDSGVDVTTFYGRDRGETGTYALSHMDIEGWLDVRKESWCEYGYLWADNTWWTYTIKGDNNAR